MSLSPDQCQRTVNDNEPERRPEHQNNDLECGICPVSLYRLHRSGVEVHSTPCGHLFCQPCLVDWIRIKETCPYCGGPISPGQSHRIYL